MKNTNLILRAKRLSKFAFFLFFTFHLSLFTFAQGVSISESNTVANPSAMLDVSSNSKGMLVPRMSTAERDAIVNPAEGLQIFNTTTKCLEIFVIGVWQSTFCASLIDPTEVTASANPNPICEGATLTLTGSATGATAWSWTGPNGFASSAQSPTIAGITTAEAGTYTLVASNSFGAATAVNTASVTVTAAPTAAAAGSDINLDCYVTTATLAGNTPTVGTGAWSVVSGIATITDITSPTSGVTGLAMNSSATLRWTITKASCAASTDDIEITTTSCDVTNTTTGKIWKDRNLGALQAATSSTDAASYGDLYQWGRAADGHQLRTSVTISTPSSSNTPGHGNFITRTSSSYDWRSPKNDNLWQGVSGANNPCPSGFRLPTEAELNSERSSWSSNNPAGAFASPLKLPVAGSRGHSNGDLNGVGSSGVYWSSTINGTDSQSLYINSNAFMNNNYRSYGFSVRCIKD